MQIDRGLVVQRQQDTAVVQLFRQESCSSCALARFCIGGKDQNPTIQVAAPSNVSIGDTVEVTVDDSAVLKASLLFYGIPLVTFLTGVFGGYGLTLLLRGSQGEATITSIICGFVLAIGGIFPARHLAGRLGLVARITRILQEGHK